MDVQIGKISELENEARAMVATARAFMVATPEDQGAAQRLTIEAARRIKIAEDFFKPIKQAQDAAKRVTLAQERKIVEPLKEVKGILAAKDMAFRAEQQRVADIEARRIEAEQRKEEEDRKLAEAQSLQDAGFADEAEAVVSAPVEVAPVYVAPATVKESGISYRDNWSAHVTDVLALCRYVAEHPEQINLIEPNTVALNQTARAMKQAMNIPGVRAVNNPIQSVKA